MSLPKSFCKVWMFHTCDFRLIVIFGSGLNMIVKASGWAWWHKSNKEVCIFTNNYGGFPFCCFHCHKHNHQVSITIAVQNSDSMCFEFLSYQVNDLLFVGLIAEEVLLLSSCPLWNLLLALCNLCYNVDRCCPLLIDLLHIHQIPPPKICHIFFGHRQCRAQQYHHK